MSDNEDIGQEELEAEKELEREQQAKTKKIWSNALDRAVDEERKKKTEPPPPKYKQREEDDDEDEDPEENAKRDNSDHSQAMEAEEEERSHAASEPGSDEADDLEDPSDESDEDLADLKARMSEKEYEKRMRKLAALKFLDLEADRGTEKAILKHCKQKVLLDEDQYEMDSAMDPEDVVTYDTDYSAGKQLQKKKDKQKEKRKSRVDSDEEEDEDAELVKKAAAAKKRKLKKIASSSSEAEDEENDPPKQSTTHLVDDDELQMMTVLTGTHPHEKVNGTTPSKKAGFHDLADIARANKEKKNQKVDPESLMDSPKKKATKKAPTSSAAAGGAGTPTTSAKKQTPKKPKPNKPEWKVGEVFECFKKVWKVTYRGEDAPMQFGTNGKYEFLPNKYHPKQFTTCQLLEPTEGGSFKETNVYDHFLTSPDRKPHRISPKYAITGWNELNTQTSDEAHEYAVEALENKNFVVDEAAGTKRMMFIPKLFEQIQKEAYRDESGEIKWCPQTLKIKDPTVNYNLKGQQVDKHGQPTTSPGADSESAAHAKKSPAKPKKEAKAKLDRVKEKDSHNVAEMIGKMAAPAPRPPATSAAATSKSSLIPANLFDEDEPTSSKRDEPTYLLNNDNGYGFLYQLMGNYIDIGVSKGQEQVLRERFNEVADTMNEASKIENPAQKRKFVTEKYKDQNGVALAMHMFPFLNKEAAKVVREKLRMV